MDTQPEIRSAERLVHGHGFGAYGLRLRGIGAELLVPAEPSWRLVELRRKVGQPVEKCDSLSDTRAVVVLRDGGTILIDREPPSALYTSPSELGDEELAHPLLAPVAAVLNTWFGNEVFHAGAVLVDDAAFGVVGERGSGKSTLLAQLAALGCPAICDDVLVAAGSDVFAGPRSIDLREDAALALRAGTGLGVVGARKRWRVVVDPIPPRVRMAGWVFLGWSRSLSLTKLTVSDRLLRLGGSRTLSRPSPDGGLVLRLAGLPGWLLERPRSWSALPEAASRLMEQLSVEAAALTRR